MDTTCARCGSVRVVPAAVVEQYSSGTDPAIHVTVAGKPDALIFRKTAHEPLLARVCGDCGHVELFVRDGAKLFERYLESGK